MITAVPQEAETSRVHWAWFVLSVQVIFSSWALSREWSANFIDRHEYRQAQTALSAYWMIEDGFRLDYPLPLFGPPWSAPLEFPTYQALVASVARMTGLPIEGSARGISALMFLLAASAFWRLGRVLEWSRSTRILAVACFMSAPVFLFYGRTVMIETTALAASAWFLAGYVEGMKTPGLGRIVLATLLGVIAGLTKATTFAAFLLVLPFFWRESWPQSRGRIRLYLFALAVPVLGALSATALWVYWSDQVKLANPFSAALASSSIRQWTWGTLEQRLSWPYWVAFYRNSQASVVATPALALLAVLLPISIAGSRRLLAGFVITYCAGALLFSNLYFVHDYYYCANACFLLLTAGLILSSAWTTQALPTPAKAIATILFFASQWASYESNYGYLLTEARAQPPAVAQAIRVCTKPEDIVVIFGEDWGALIPYYAQRKAIMIRTEFDENLAALRAVLDRLGTERVGAMLARGHARVKDDFLRARADLLGLVPAPVIEGPDDALFLRADLAIKAAGHWPAESPSGLRYNFQPEPLGEKFPMQSLPAMNRAIFTQVPRQIRGQFPLGHMLVEDEDILSVHAPTAFRFQPPQGASEVVLEVGMLPEAYLSIPHVTDGIDVAIYAHLDSGLIREVFRRRLRPAEVPGDRGTQRIVFTSNPGFTGDITVAVLSGPSDNNSKDWAYVRRVEFR